MAYYTDGDEKYQELQEMPVEHQMEKCLVEALGYHVQDSVNWALIQASKPFTKPLTNFVCREFLGEGSQQPRLHSGDSRGASGLSLLRAGGSSSAEILAQMAASVLRDHEYGGPTPQDASSSSTQAGFHESSSSKSESDDSQAYSLPRKKLRKTQHSTPDINAPAGKNLLFSPEDIMHPRSTDWVPSEEIFAFLSSARGPPLLTRCADPLPFAAPWPAPEPQRRSYRSGDAPSGPCGPQRPACVSRAIHPTGVLGPSGRRRAQPLRRLIHPLVRLTSFSRPSRHASLRAPRGCPAARVSSRSLLPTAAHFSLSAIRIRYLRAGARRRFGPRGAPYVGRYRAASSAHGGSGPGCSTGSSQPFTALLFRGGRVKGHRLGSSFVGAPQSWPPCWILAGRVAASARGSVPAATHIGGILSIQGSRGAS
ncbi:hypothetical protein NDU88_001999 [Pleurodeles waltl]|uniref:Uncharacterized protein n=1 Tax=Pleurodeles waltl TaxID=8319 RepID=A0AAV7W1P5_PLEWA|nr:hypothetical protein NDU88_001999 [Pleurodeles waltl]